MEESSSIRMRGFLWKRARGRSMASTFHKPWALRWFELEGNILSYFDHRDDNRVPSRMKGSLIVDGVTVELDPDSSRSHAFIVRGCRTIDDHNKVEQLHVAAPDDHEMGQWMAILTGSHKSEGWRWIVDRQAGTGEPVSNRRAISKSVTKITQLYDVREQLGSGGFSIVKKGVCKENGQMYALKMIPFSIFQKNRDQTEAEVRLLAGLSHPGIVKLKEVVHTPKHFVIVMEYLRGGELFDRILERKRYNEHDAKLVAAKILDALRYLHENDIVHRDVKPENIMFESNAESAQIKLTDFGFATLFDRSRHLTTACGTPEYVAPEIILEHSYGTAVDLWSMGVVLYILLCGFPPFFGETEEIMFDRICHARYHFVRPFWDNVSKEAKHLIRHLLDLDPEKRLTAQQALEHPWFNDVVSGSATSTTPDGEPPDLINVLSELRRYNASRKFRKGVLVVMAANRLVEGFRLSLTSSHSIVED